MRSLIQVLESQRFSWAVVLLHFRVVELYELLVVNFLPPIKSLNLMSSVTHALMRYEWVISSFLDDPNPWLAGSYAVNVSSWCSARYFFELYWSCCHWTVVFDSLLWVGSQWLITWSPWACIWLQLLPLFPRVFTSSLRNDAHPYMVITWWALIISLIFLIN